MIAYILDVIFGTRIGYVIKKQNTKAHPAASPYYYFIKIKDINGVEKWIAMTQGQYQDAIETASKNPEDLP